MTDSSSKLLQIQGKWYQERKPKNPEPEPKKLSKNYSEPNHQHVLKQVLEPTGEGAVCCTAHSGPFRGMGSRSSWNATVHLVRHKKIWSCRGHGVIRSDLDKHIWVNMIKSWNLAQNPTKKWFVDVSNGANKSWNGPKCEPHFVNRLIDINRPNIEPVSDHSLKS